MDKSIAGREAAALIKANDRLQQQVLSSIHEAIAIINHDYIITYWNAVAEKIYGWSADEATGKNVVELLRIEVPGEGVDNVFTRALKEISYGGDMILYHQDGWPVPTHVHAQVIRDEQGEFLGIVATFRDMTGSVECQQKLAFQARILDNVHDAVAAVDENDIITYCNKAFEDMFGLPREEILGQRNTSIIQRFAVPDDQAQILQRFNERGFRILGENNFTDIGCINQNGATIYLDINTTMLVGPYDEYRGFIASVRDITERKMAEDERRKSEQWLALAISVGRLGTYDGCFESGESTCNDEFYRILGYQPGEVRPTMEAFWERVHPGNRDADMAHMAENMRKGGYSTHEIRLMWRDGTIRWIENRAYVEHDKGGQPLRYYGVIIDVTRFKLAEQALRESEQRLEEMVRERTRELETAQKKPSRR